jgi:Dolichyl-phosphate-mannose-protein mannosyltransferase
LNPPLEYLAVRATTGILGQGGYAVRLPSIAAFLAGSLCLRQFVANRLTDWYGLMAMLVLWGSPFFYYATEARPYALVAGFLGATLLFWQRATEPDRRIGWAVALGLSVAAMMLSHLMALAYVVPFCLAETVRFYQRRRADLAVSTALLIPCIIPFIYGHLITRFEASVFPPPFQASLRKIAESYYGSLKIESIPLLLALALAWLTAPQHFERRRHIQPVQRADLAIAAAMTAVPVLVNLVLIRTHGAYFDRYALPVAFGYALAFAILLANRTDQSARAAMVASGILLLFVLMFNLGPGRKQSVWARRNEITHTRTIEQVRPDLPLVAASGLTFLEMDHYSDPQTVSRLYYLTDRKLAVHYASATIFEGMPTLKDYFPIRAHVTGYWDFIAAHPEFLVLGTPDYPEDWLLNALIDQGAQVRYLGNFPGDYKDTQLFLIRKSGA